MATVISTDGRTLSREEQIRALVAAGISEEYARFVVAVERRELPGDLIEVNEEEVADDD